MYSGPYEVVKNLGVNALRLRCCETGKIMDRNLMYIKKIRKTEENAVSETSDDQTSIISNTEERVIPETIRKSYLNQENERVAREISTTTQLPANEPNISYDRRRRNVKPPHRYGFS